MGAVFGAAADVLRALLGREQDWTGPQLPCQVWTTPGVSCHSPDGFLFLLLTRIIDSRVRLELPERIVILSANRESRKV